MQSRKCINLKLQKSNHNPENCSNTFHHRLLNISKYRNIYVGKTKGTCLSISGQPKINLLHKQKNSSSSSNNNKNNKKKPKKSTKNGPGSKTQTDIFPQKPLQVGPMLWPFCRKKPATAMASPWTCTLAVRWSEPASRTVNGAQHWKPCTMRWRYLWRWGCSTAGSGGWISGRKWFLWKFRNKRKNWVEW